MTNKKYFFIFEKEIIAAVSMKIDSGPCDIKIRKIK